MGKNKTKKEKVLKAIEDVKLASEEEQEEQQHGQGKLARALASVHPQTREKGLRALTVWLTRKASVTEKDMLRLWKALFYTYWHSDLVPVQTALAERLSAIMLIVPEEVSQLYFKTFVRTMRREWFGIDKHRIDKFMLLVRKFYRAHLQQLQERGWDMKLVKETGKFWIHEVMLPTDTLVASGFKYHIADIFIPELISVCKEARDMELDSRPSSRAVRALMNPFITALAGTQDRTLIYRLQKGFFEPLVAELEDPSEGNPLKNFGAGKFADHLFTLGALPETRAANRQVLYEMSNKLETITPSKTKSPLSVKRREDHENSTDAVSAGRRSGTEAIPSVERKKPKKKTKVLEKKTNDTVGSVDRKQTQATSNKEEDDSDAVCNGIGEKGAISSDVETPSKNVKHDGNSTATPVNVANGNIGTEHRLSVSRSKSVRFGLKRNLVNYIGQPPMPEDIRTPPNCKPKGSALKRSALGLESAPGRLQKRTATGKSKLRNQSNQVSKGEVKASPIRTRKRSRLSNSM